MLTLTRRDPNLALFTAPRHTAPCATQHAWRPPVDLRETEAAYVLTTELPGLKKADISISVEDNVLTLSGERQKPPKTDGETWYRRERAAGKFSRSFRFGTEVDAGSAKASLKNGLLTLTLPKSENAKPRKISVH